jgi:N-acetyl-gamma-glutamyl-phosphate reductase
VWRVPHHVMRILAYMSNQVFSAGVAGASGYVGGELLRLIAGHQYLSLRVAAAGAKAGEPICSVHPALIAYAEQVFMPTNPATLADCDVVFLALPHGQSAEIAAKLPRHVVVVDLGADHRLADPSAWQQFYGGGHAGSWLYGMPELPNIRESLRGAVRIANPGCYPTAVALALAPLLRERLLEPEDLVIVAASGTSGAGRKASEALLGSEVMGAMSAYKVGGVHQHTPEIEQALSHARGARVSVSFTPTLAPMPRGILATCTGKLRPGVAAPALRDALTSAYDDEGFIHVLPEGRWPTTAAVVGSNSVQVQVVADSHSGRAIVVAAMDNLVKGAAGQAVQNANLALELPEDTGLTTMGVAP